MDKSKLIKLFTSIFKLSACTFGGGFVIVPLMRRRFVEELGWIEEQEMLDITAIAQSSPGAIAVNAAILIGYKTAGVIGALITILAAVTPPLVIISVISTFYKAFRDNPIVGRIMAGMLCGVAAVILDVVIKMISTIVKNRRILPIIVLIAAFVAVRFFSVSVIPVILVCGAIGAADALLQGKRSKGGAER